MREWVFGVVTALAAATLLDAGLYKLVRPGELRRALRELSAATIGDTLVRTAAVVEILCAVLILLPALSTVGAVGAGILGLCFAVLGIAGRVRGSVAPCGCLGYGDGRAFGIANVLIGLSVVVGMLGYLWSRPRVEPVVVALFMVLLTFWTNRRGMPDGVGVWLHALGLGRRRGAAVRDVR